MFDFGKNWQEFSREYGTPERLDIAAQSLESLLGHSSLAGLSFLDVGCGSGLFSIAASTLGAKRVVGIDVNPRSVQASCQNLQTLAPKSDVVFTEMSVLDETALARLGTFDIVYAWGSLHHTGAMLQAIRNAGQRVTPGGTFVVALYNRHWSSPFWNGIKSVYAKLPRRAQEVVAVPFGGVIYVAKFLVTRQNPLAKERGMDFWYDVIDWLGGYPYEYASTAEAGSFLRSLGFSVTKTIPASVPTGCNEFVATRCSERALQ